MKRSVIIAAVGAAVLVAGAGGGWLLYKRHLSDLDTVACFDGTDPDACFRQAVIAFQNGQISEEDRLMTQHCYQRNGIVEGGTPNIRGAAVCIVDLRRRVEASAALK